MNGIILSGFSWGLIIPIAIVVLLIVIIFVAGYVKASPDTAIIIYFRFA